MPRLLGYLLLWAIAPPILATLGYVLIRGWSSLVSGGKAPNSVIRRERLEFKLMLIGFYTIFLVGFIIGLAEGRF